RGSPGGRPSAASGAGREAPRGDPPPAPRGARPGPLPMTDLALEAVSYRYPNGGVLALDAVDLQIPAGQRVALIGQNGSGKTTLVRHFNALLRPTAGRVLHDGADVAPRTVAQLARSVGLAFQDPDRQIFAGSVRREVEWGPRNLGRSGNELRTAVEEALAEVGLESEAGTNPYDLGAS